MRKVIGILLLPVAAFCAVGFLAAGEPGVATEWRIGYAVTGGLAIVGALLLLAIRRHR